MIEVTVLFKNQEQFDKFLRTNKVEEYTWRKGKITIDLSGAVKSAMEDAPARTEEIAATEEAPAAQESTSMF